MFDPSQWCSRSNLQRPVTLVDYLAVFNFNHNCNFNKCIWSPNGPIVWSDETHVLHWEASLWDANHGLSSIRSRLFLCWHFCIHSVVCFCLWHQLVGRLNMSRLNRVFVDRNLGNKIKFTRTTKVKKYAFCSTVGFKASLLLKNRISLNTFSPISIYTLSTPKPKIRQEFVIVKSKKEWKRVNGMPYFGVVDIVFFAVDAMCDTQHLLFSLYCPCLIPKSEYENLESFILHRCRQWALTRN